MGEITGTDIDPLVSKWQLLTLTTADVTINKILSHAEFCNRLSLPLLFSETLRSTGLDRVRFMEYTYSQADLVFSDQS